jgi:hypothetical protein
MKKLLYKLFAIALIGLVGSCNFIDPELNVDPNSPLDVQMSNILPAPQTMYAYVLGGDFGRYTTIWSQHHAGVERQHAAYDVYVLLENDVNNAWNNMYAVVMQDLSIIKAKADGTGSPHYAGVAKVMEAMALATMVDLFGDVPYSEALQGEAEEPNLKPAYDGQADLYGTIQDLLDEAIADLSNEGSTFSPGADDLIFGGDLSAWIAAANSLKARYYVRLSEVSGTAYADALDALDAGAIADNAGDAQFNFGSAFVEQNPWYQFEDQRGDVNMGGFFIDLMNSIDDPRRTVFATTNADGDYVGAAAGVPDNGPGISRFGSAYGSANSPVPFVSYVETKFLEAEAALDTDPDRAATAHNEAITASLAKFGVSDAAYLAAQANEDGSTITLEKILTHKYIALYTMQEPYNDWRRKGIPDLQPAAGETQIAVRYPYPINERLYNGENWPGNVNLFTDNIFWDQ